MRYLTKASFLLSAVLILSLPILVAVRLVNAAGTATMSLSPSSTTVAQGASFDVDVHEDSGSDTVNGVVVKLTYSGNLQFLNVTNSADWPVAATTTGGSGSIDIERGAFTPVSGDNVVATIRFTAKTAGSASVSFASGSAVIRSQDHTAEALTTTGGTYNITSPATMTLSPATKSVGQGDSFDVAVYENSGSDTVNAVQANLSYPASLLSFVSITPNDSAWPIQADNSGGNGLVKIGRGTTGTLTGSQLIATVRFTAAAAGNAQVAFASGSGVIRSTDNTAEPSTNTGGSYAIAAAASPPPSGGGSGGTTGGITGGTTTNTKKTTSSLPPPKSYTSAPAAQSSPSTAPADTTGPVISDIKVTNLTTQSATINWTTSEPATAEVDYGLNTDFILSASDASLATSHSLSLDPKGLVGHKTYHFVIKSTDGAGNQSVSKDMTFSTGGIQITKTEIAVAAGALVLGSGIWFAAAGGLKLGGAAMVASGGGIYVEPKPIIVGGGAPPPPPAPVVHPQPVQKPAASAPPQAAAKAPVAQESQTPGKVVGPKDAPPVQADDQTLPKWVKK